MHHPKTNQEQRDALAAKYGGLGEFNKSDPVVIDALNDLVSAETELTRIDNDEKTLHREKQKHLAGLDTTDYRLAPSGEGKLAGQWKDKPHRLVYDLCSALEAQRERLTFLATLEATFTDFVRSAIEKKKRETDAQPLP